MTQINAQDNASGDKFFMINQVLCLVPEFRERGGGWVTILASIRRDTAVFCSTFFCSLQWIQSAR